MSTQPHDAVFRAVFSQPEHAAGELQAVLPAALSARIDWSTLRREPGSYIDEELRGRHTDLLFSVVARGVGGDGESRRAFLYILVEHQSEPDDFMLLRILVYEVRIWQKFRQDFQSAKRLPAIIPVVIHHGKGGWTAPTRFAELLDWGPDEQSELAPFVPTFQLLLDDLGRVSNDDIRARTMATAYARLTLFFLRNARNPDELREKLSDFGALLRAHLRTPTGQEDLLQLLRYHMIVNEGLPVFLKKAVIEATADEEATMSMWDILQAEGEARGEARGEAKGKAKAVIAVLKARGIEPTAEMSARILACRDDAQLEQWITRAVTAPSVADVVGDA